jgi:ribosomal protein S27E
MSRTPPRRHWRRHGTDPLPTGAGALDEPFDAFPSWFLRITCARCGQERVVNQVHAAQSDLTIRVILDKMRHDGCGGRARIAELLTGVEGISSRPVRRIVLREV